MQYLRTEPNFGVPGERYLRAFTPGDDFYQLLIDAHRDLSDEQSRLFRELATLEGEPPSRSGGLWSKIKEVLGA